MSPFKNILVSVSNKNGLVEFLAPMAQAGARIVSTGGTAKTLRDAGITVVDVSEQTHFPEVMDGRVKTLHPRIHMALLSREGNVSDQKLLAQEGLEPFDLLIANLYPFEQGLEKSLASDEQVEMIDIGGPSLLRAAAKNFSRLTVVVDPKDYPQLKLQKPDISQRRSLAAKVFAHTASYDSLVSQWLDATSDLPEMAFGGHFVKSLRYGENPQQQAKWLRRGGAMQGLHRAEILQGKELSYNNLLDLDGAIRTLQEFQKPCCVAVKHNNPCGVGLGEDIDEAVAKACAADPVSIFGGIVAVNRPLTKTSAERLSEIFLECLIAPEIDEDVRSLFQRKKNLRVMQWPSMLYREESPVLKSILGGYLIQTPDRVDLSHQDWSFPDGKPNESILSDLWLAWKTVAHLKSNAIAIAGGGQTLGLGMGQVNRVEAVDQAILRWKQHHANIKTPVMASDAFFPFPDSVLKAADAGIEWIIQPGGSVRDEEVFEAAKKVGVKMVITAKRHFLH